MREVADPRLLASLALLAKAECSSVRDRTRWEFEQPLPTSMGGADVGGLAELAGGCFTASVLGCAAELLHLPAYSGVDVERASTGLFGQMRSAYELILKAHSDIVRTYKDFDRHPYFTLRGGKLAGYYRPQKLPRTLPSIADVLDSESEIHPPAQRALNMVMHHKRWLAALEAVSYTHLTLPTIHLV